MKRMGSLPVEKTHILGPPAMGSMKAKELDSVTANSRPTGLRPCCAAATTMMGPATIDRLLKGAYKALNDTESAYKAKIIQNICKVSLLCSALYTKCPYYLVLYMQSVLII